MTNKLLFMFIISITFINSSVIADWCCTYGQVTCNDYDVNGNFIGTHNQCFTCSGSDSCKTPGTANSCNANAPLCNRSGWQRGKL